MAETRLEALPEECLSRVISFTSPQDACRTSLVSASFRSAADSDLAWENFLPPDCAEILSASVSPVEFSSKKDLFRRLSSTPLLIDQGKKTFSIDKYTNKKCYVLSARELSIAWSSNSLCWCRKPLPHSRFPEAIELVMVCWLEIHGKVKCEMLSPNTTYGAYLIMQVADRAFGLGTVPSEVSVEVGGYRSGGTVCVKREECKTEELEGRREGEEGMVCRRGDGWREIELGEFYNSGGEEEVKMWFRETKGVHLKGGLLVEGIELRPKRVCENVLN